MFIQDQRFFIRFGDFVSFPIPPSFWGHSFDDQFQLKCDFKKPIILYFLSSKVINGFELQIQHWWHHPSSSVWLPWSHLWCGCHLSGNWRMVQSDGQKQAATGPTMVSCPRGSRQSVWLMSLKKTCKPILLPRPSNIPWWINTSVNLKTGNTFFNLADYLNRDGFESNWKDSKNVNWKAKLTLQPK